MALSRQKKQRIFVAVLVANSGLYLVNSSADDIALVVAYDELVVL